jgi:hypothetical protein
VNTRTRSIDPVDTADLAPIIEHVEVVRVPVTGAMSLSAAENERHLRAAVAS